MLNRYGGICVLPETGKDLTGRTAMKTESTTVNRIKRTLIALLLMFVLSFTSVLAETEPNADNPENTVQTEASTDTGDGDSQVTVPQQETPAVEEPAQTAEEPAPAPAAGPTIFKKGKYYYYKDAGGKIRKKAGFVTVEGKKYYVKKGGKIKTNAIFKVKKKSYCADKYGVINTGLFKWKGDLYYSEPSGVLRSTEGFVTWDDYSYFVQKSGKVVVNAGFSYKNIPYGADADGRTQMLEIPDGDGSPVVKIAKDQVGIMTGKKYWVWYYKTRFIDTDRTPWCGAFVAWCYKEAGLYKKITVAKKFGPLGYVPSYSRYANKYKKWVNRKDARGGDIIVFGRNRHVGLVEGISGDYIITIEGNAGPTAAIGCKKPGAVVRNAYRINSSSIKGVIRP